MLTLFILKGAVAVIFPVDGGRADHYTVWLANNGYIVIRVYIAALVHIGLFDREAVTVSINAYVINSRSSIGVKRVNGR